MSRHRLVGSAGNLKAILPDRALVEAVAAVLAQQRDVDLSVYGLIDPGPGLEAQAPSSAAGRSARGSRPGSNQRQRRAWVLR